jgi:flagellar hook-associated protein 2
MSSIEGRMSTSTSSLGTAASTSPFAPVTLNGVSQYSSDLQNVLNRAVGIAQIPITRLQNSDATVLSKEGLLGQLQTAVQSVATDLSSLGSVASSEALSANSSDNTVISATDSGATSPASYTIDSVTSMAAAANETSLTSYTDSTTIPVSTTGSMELVVGSKNYSIPLTSATNNLNGLASAINSLNAGVTASVLTTSKGNYLSVSAGATGATTLQVVDNPSSITNPGGTNTQWLSAKNQGTDAVFELNGITVKQPSNTVNDVIPGITFNILGTSNTPTTLSLASDPTQLTSALQTFVGDYNSLRTALNAQEGPAAGALSGDTSIVQLEGAMRRLTAYTSASSGSSSPGNPSTSSIQSLSDLGITFASNGQASLDPSVVGGLSDSQLAGALKFVGSATSGLGGLSTTFQQFSDPTSGLLQTEAKGLATTDQSLQSQITTLTSRLTVMQDNLASQLSSADALIAELQSQQTTVTASLQGLNVVLYGKNTSTL